jgi:hypothetical protein
MEGAAFSEPASICHAKNREKAANPAFDTPDALRRP